MDLAANSDDSFGLLLRLEVPLKKELEVADYRCNTQFDVLNDDLEKRFQIYRSVLVRTEAQFDDTVEGSYQVNPKQSNDNGLSEGQVVTQCIAEFFTHMDALANTRDSFRRIDSLWRGTVILHSQRWFSTSIDSCLENNLLNELHFGVFYRGLFNSHWEVRFDESERKFSQMKLDCFFDQNNLIARFFNQERGLLRNQNGNGRCDGVACYRVQIQLQTIRRIAVDLGGNDCSATLYLDLTTPAVVKRSIGLTKEESETSKQSRWLRIQRGIPYMNYGSTETVLVENSVLAFKFSEAKEPASNGSFAITKTFWQILSRLRIRCNLSVEFRRLEIVSEPYGCRSDGIGSNPYCDWVSEEAKETDCPATHPDENVFKDFLTKTFGDNPKSSIKEEKRLVHYLIEALISRGSVVKDHILRNHINFNRFLFCVHDFYKKEPQACIESLKRLLLAVDEQKRIDDLIEAFVVIYKKLIASDEAYGLSESEKKEGYQLVPRVVITPTRNLRIQPEMCMGNRVLRGQVDGEDEVNIVIRVSFRDDDNSMLRQSKTSEYLLTRTIQTAFDKGIFVAGKRYFYLGSSSSQMRDCGAYFMQGITDAAHAMYQMQFPGYTLADPRLSIRLNRQNLGKFLQLKTAPKIMARLGQCFTQSRASRVCLNRNRYCTEPDFIGGRKQLVDEPYCFTDGVGLMHPDFAQRVSDDMRLNSIPSCYQYRFRGHKGVQVVDPYLQELEEWAKKYKISNTLVRPANKGIQSTWSMDCVFRPSQIKFSAKRYNDQPIEVVKFSGPTTVCLNKPLINIFDQVSERQSYECHRRITNRIEDLLNIQTRYIVRMLLVEKHCRNKLKEMPRRFDVDVLSHFYGFELCREPFFGALLRASVRFMITKQLRKEQIQIPHSLGRSLLGVNDTTNRLQYGQVFVQYTNDIREYSPREFALKTVVTGRVMVTKNPTSVGGDIRVFEAVDIPELRHLVDVVVFPVHGPRPMPDEMAGSDLDGDEYSVFWDPDLLIDYNMDPATYETESKKSSQVVVTKENLEESVRDAYIEYVKNDNIGVIANALLFQSDLYGIESKVVQDLALKANQAVEFLKSGIAPERLRDKWSQVDSEEPKSEWLPPEKPERYPDYHFGNDYRPIYVSPRLTGKLYRDIKQIEDALRLVEEKERDRELELDPLLEQDGWRIYEDQALQTMDSYNGKLRTIMETYGIRTEAEIMSNCICDMRNRITDKDQDDFSYYNQRSAIESRVTEIMREYREKFFEEFGGWRLCTREEDIRDEGNVFRRKAMYLSENMLQKASAYYMVAYQRNSHTRMLSFPWLVFDVLASVRQRKVYHLEDHVVHAVPVYDLLNNHIKSFIELYPTKKEGFIEDIEKVDIIRKYCKLFPGVIDVLYTMHMWAEFGGHYTIRFKMVHLSLLFLLFATGRLSSAEGNAKVFLDYTLSEAENRVEMSNKGELVLSFFEYLSSRKFRTLKHLSFAELGVHSVFLRGEWLGIHWAAGKTYLSIAFSMNFDDLPLTKNCAVQSKVLQELPPFIIELSEKSDVVDIARLLKLASGVEQVSVRKLNRFRKPGSEVTGLDLAAVVCRGPLENCYKLRNLVAVKPNLYNKYNAKELSKTMPTMILKNIDRALNEAFAENPSADIE